MEKRRDLRWEESIWRREDSVLTIESFIDLNVESVTCFP